MFPSKAMLYLAPFTDENAFYSSKVLFWNDVYGLNFSAIM